MTAAFILIILMQMRWATLVFDHDPEQTLELFYWSDNPFPENRNGQFQNYSLGGGFQNVLALLPTPENPSQAKWDAESRRLVYLSRFAVRAQVGEIDWKSVDFSSIGAFIWKKIWCAGVAAVDGMTTPTQEQCLKESINEIIPKMSGSLTVSVYDCFLDF